MYGAINGSVSTGCARKCHVEPGWSVRSIMRYVLVIKPSERSVEIEYSMIMLPVVVPDPRISEPSLSVATPDRQADPAFRIVV